MDVKARGDYRFDLDLKKGQYFENALLEMITTKGDKIEVKADRMVSMTGNLAIEFKCRGKLSGISTSESDWYAFVLGGDIYDDEVIILVTTERLKQIVKKVYKKNKKVIHGGDGNLSEMILIQVYDLLRPKK